MQSGAEQRSALMLESLLEFGHVDVLWLSPGGSDQIQILKIQDVHCVRAVLSNADGVLNRFEPKILESQKWSEALNFPIDAYDLVVGRYLWGISQLALANSTKTLIDLDDYKFRFSSRQILTLKHLHNRARKYLGHFLLRRQLSRFTAAFVSSSKDLAEVTASSTLKVCLLPNVVPAPGSPRSDVLPVSHQVLFVGSLWYGPNAEGIEWFLWRVWPEVRRCTPDASLLLVGSAPASLRQRWSLLPGVNAPGFIDDLAEVYAKSAVVVVPVQSGGGTNIKVLEALSHGRPCVVSAFVAGAFAPQLRAGEHFLVADSPHDFALQVNDLLHTSGQQEKNGLPYMVGAGQLAVLTLFKPEIFQKTIRCFLRKLLARP